MSGWVEVPLKCLGLVSLLQTVAGEDCVGDRVVLLVS